MKTKHIPAIALTCLPLIALALITGCQVSEKPKPAVNAAAPVTPKTRIATTESRTPVKSTAAAAHSRRPAPAVAVPETPLRAEVPKSFTWNYTFQPEPGLRKWTRIGNTKFVERYPSGKENTFTIVEQTTVDSIQGTLLQIVGGKLQAFMPDKGSANMYFKMRATADQNWGHMGEMKDVE